MIVVSYPTAFVYQFCFPVVGLQGLLGLLVKLASGSVVAVRTLFELDISSILKDILSTYNLSHGVPSASMVDGHSDQVISYIIQCHWFIEQYSFMQSASVLLT